jgi:tetratricopeptide (TPR) repeat protein
LNKPVQVFCVAFDRNVNFTGQTLYLDKIVENYRNPSYHNHRIALFGLGGVGKSQIALQYCFQHKTEYTYVFWISGADRQKLLSGYRDIASEIKDIELRPDMSPDMIAKVVIKWLESTSGWLLVVDNLDDISAAEGCLPAIDAQGHTLITSRDKHINHIAEAIRILPMDPDEARALLLQLVKDDGKDSNVSIEAIAIVRELGFLPLAIDHAAAYIRVTEDIFNYLRSYRSNARELLNWRRRGYATDQITVATTWDMSFKRLKSEGGHYTEFIRLLAFLNPDEILVEYLQAGAQGLTEPLQDVVDSSVKLTECIDALETYSLVRVWPGGKSIQIHRLVQWVIRESLDFESRVAMVGQVIGLSLEAFPACDGRNFDICRRYFSQILPSLSIMDKELTESAVPQLLDGWDDLLDRVALNLQHDGYTSEPIPLLLKTLEIRKKYFGADNEKTLDTAIDLATAYVNSDQVKEAEELLKSTLDIVKDTEIWEDGPGVTALRVMEKLALISRDENTFREVCDLRKRVQGPEHRDTLHTETNIAVLIGERGRLEEERALHLDILARKRQLVHEEDEEITYSMNWLAEVDIKLGRYIEAETLLKEALERRRKLRGSRHPRTLWNIDTLAQTYKLMGRTEDAEKLEKEKAEALICERRLGQ